MSQHAVLRVSGLGLQKHKEKAEVVAGACADGGGCLRQNASPFYRSTGAMPGFACAVPPECCNVVRIALVGETTKKMSWQFVPGVQLAGMWPKPFASIE